MLEILRVFEFHLNIPIPSTRRAVLLAIIAILALDFIAIGLNVPILRQFLGLISLLVVPGFLLVLLCKIVCDNFWEYLIISLGTSIALLMFLGLILNQAFILLHISDPLSVINVVMLISFSCLVMVIAIWFQNKEDSFFIKVIRQYSIKWELLFLIPIVFPVLGAAGAILLNIGATNLVAVATVIFISIYVLWISLSYKQKPEDLLAISIISIGLTLLLSFSMRSLHISGWDINQEFFVYQLTRFHQEWRIDFFKDPYNSCLSLTILPTILNDYLGINDEYIFKIIYQFIFAFVPLVIYLTAKRYVAPILAFLASMFFVFQPWFIQPAPALARQEIALLFFALIIWVTFNFHLTHIQRISLQLLFGMAMIISHYSTAYVALIIFILTYSASFLLRIFPKTRKYHWRTKSIPGWVILVLCAFTFYWGSIQTGTTGNVVYVFQITMQNMKNALASDLRSEDLKLAFLHASTNFDIRDVNSYVKAQSEIYSQQNNLYPKESYSTYSPEIAKSPELNGFMENGAFRDMVSSIFFIAKQLTKVILILGGILWIFYALRGKYSGDEFVFLNIFSIGLLLLWLILPVLSLYYNVFRLYLQTLIVSAISMIIGLNLILSKFSKTGTDVRLITLLVIFFYFSTNGVSAYLVGGPANMNLNNFGDEYDKFYTRSQEISSAHWLAANRDPNVRIYADDTASLRLISFGNGIIYHDTAVLPSTITKDSYIFMDYANIWSGVTEAKEAGKQITYKYPTKFIEENKSLIYDNGGSRVYR